MKQFITKIIIALLLFTGITGKQVKSQDWLDVATDVLDKANQAMTYAKLANVLLSSDARLAAYLNKRANSRIMSKYDVYEHEKLSKIGHKLAQYSSRPNLSGKNDYDFYILDQDNYNAFALPGGTIYITRPLVEKYTVEEIAFVLGHEITHVTQKHSVKQLKRTSAFQGLTQIAQQVLKEEEDVEQTLSFLVNTSFQLAQKGFSRSQELKCDLTGVKLAYKAGYDPDAAISALQKLKQYTGGGSKNCILWNSHPRFDKRIRKVSLKITSLPGYQEEEREQDNYERDQYEQDNNTVTQGGDDQSSDNENQQTKGNAWDDDNETTESGNNNPWATDSKKSMSGNNNNNNDNDNPWDAEGSSGDNNDGSENESNPWD